MITRQEIFDTALMHIRKQGQPGWCPMLGCQYTTSDGKHCAAWPFLTDEAQKNSDISGDWRNIPDTCKRDGMLSHEGLIRELQHIHDTSAEDSPNKNFMPIFEQRMKNFAELNNLEWSDGAPSN